MRDLVALRARAGCDRVALASTDSTLTYGALEVEASGLAAALAGRRRVATLLPAGPESVLALHAAWRAGAAAVPLDPRAPTEALLAAARLLRPDAVVAAQATRDVALGLDVPVVAVHDRGRPEAPPARIAPSDLAAIVLTSGTTREPKAARLTWRNLLHAAAASAERLGTGPRDRFLLALPVRHVGGLSIVVRAALHGAAVVATRRFDAGETNELVDRGAVTVASFVPTQLRRVLDDRGNRRVPATFRLALVGGAPVASALVERARAVGFPVRRTYGLTEASSQVATEDADGVVRPLRGVEVRCVDGEIQVRGATVSDGYEGESSASGDGWLRTGDLGEVDGRGALRVLGRKDDVVISGGEKVAPAEVEAALLAHPAVVEACVVGVPDEDWGERVAAVIQLAAPVAERDLREHLRTRLPPEKRPKTLRVLEEIPRLESGKVDRRRVRALLSSEAVHAESEPGSAFSAR